MVTLSASSLYAPTMAVFPSEEIATVDPKKSLTPLSLALIFACWSQSPSGSGSVPVNVKSYVPAVVKVPDRTPVLVDRPLGNVPPVVDESAPKSLFKS